MEEGLLQSIVVMPCLTMTGGGHLLQVMTTAVMLRKDSIRKYIGQPSLMPFKIPSTKSVLIHVGPGVTVLDSGSGTAL